MKTEVEIRAFLSRGQYLKLLKFFKKEDKKYFLDSQETIYFSGKSDLRIQKNKKFSKIWLKSGKIHQDVRQETEIIVPREKFSELLHLFLELGYKISIKWLRKRYAFKWHGLEVFLDYTKGYGYIIELEKSTTKKENFQNILKNLRNKLFALKVKETSKEEFDKKYKYYAKHWQKLIER